MRPVKVNFQRGQPLLNIASYARPGIGRRDRLSQAEIALVSRTVRRVPEVMLKVLTNGSTSTDAISRHFGYLGRYGELALETDEGDQLQGRGLGGELVERWDLDLDEHRRSGDLSPSSGRRPAKLVHKLMLSMPAGTPPGAVLAAARNFLREEFALKHRYALVLHTDEPHPHVHAVVKAVSESGVRLHIKKATLRRWRADFARHLREQGIEANATERAVRGQNRVPKRDAIYRAAQRGRSSHIIDRVKEVVRELAHSATKPYPEIGRAKLGQTREEVVRGWRAMQTTLQREGWHDLANDVQRFIQEMPPAGTEKELLARQLLERTRVHNRGQSPTR